MVPGIEYSVKSQVTSGREGKNRCQIMWKGSLGKSTDTSSEQTQNLDRAAHFKILSKGK